MSDLIFDLEALSRAVKDGLVLAKRRGALTIYDYTPKCVESRAWTETTMQARGLVLDDAGRAVALPFRRFFNLGEPGGVSVEEATRLGEACAWDKLDGSLIIAFADPEDRGRWTCITRGSWSSWQATRATSILRTSNFRGDPQMTYLFELVGPENRVVVPYDRERLVLIGARSIKTGRDLPSIEVDWLADEDNLVTAERFRLSAVTSLDLTGETWQKEGYVITWETEDGVVARAKMKTPEYVRVHGIVTNMSPVTIWERVRSGRTDLDGVPDEFLGWYRTVEAGLHGEFAKLEERVNEAWNEKDWRALPRKVVAEAFCAHGGWLKACLFARLSHKEYADVLWNEVRPVPGQYEAWFAGRVGPA